MRSRPIGWDAVGHLSAVTARIFAYVGLSEKRQFCSLHKQGEIGYKISLQLVEKNNASASGFRFALVLIFLQVNRGDRSINHCAYAGVG